MEKKESQCKARNIYRIFSFTLYSLPLLLLYYPLDYYHILIIHININIYILILIIHFYILLSLFIFSLPIFLFIFSLFISLFSFLLSLWFWFYTKKEFILIFSSLFPFHILSFIRLTYFIRIISIQLRSITYLEHQE